MIWTICIQNYIYRLAGTGGSFYNLSLVSVFIFSSLQRWKFLTQSFWKFGTPVGLEKTQQTQTNKQMKTPQNSSWLMERPSRESYYTGESEKERGRKSTQPPCETRSPTCNLGDFQGCSVLPFELLCRSVFSHLNGSIIDGTGFFGDNALAVLLFEAIFKLNKASPLPEMQITQWLSSNRNSQAAPSCGSGKRLPYKQTWPREAGLLACKNNLHRGRVNSLHLLQPLGCVTELLVERRISTAARKTQLWDGRTEKLCFTHLFVEGRELLTGVLPSSAGKRASLCLALARGIKTVQSEVFQPLCPVLLCKAHAGK